MKRCTTCQNLVNDADGFCPQCGSMSFEPVADMPVEPVQEQMFRPADRDGPAVVLSARRPVSAVRVHPGAAADGTRMGTRADSGAADGSLSAARGGAC